MTKSDLLKFFFKSFFKYKLAIFKDFCFSLALKSINVISYFFKIFFNLILNTIGTFLSITKAIFFVFGHNLLIFVLSELKMLLPIIIEYFIFWFLNLIS